MLAAVEHQMFPSLDGEMLAAVEHQMFPSLDGEGVGMG